MTNTTALWIGGAIIALFLADAFVLGWELPTVLGRLFLDVIDWLAFWR